MKAIPKLLVCLPMLCVAPTRVAAEDVTVEAPPEANILDVAADETSQPDGLRSRWTSVAYELSTGHEAEMFVEVDERGRGVGYIFVDGEVLVHVTTDAQGGTTTWVAPDMDLPHQARAELVPSNLADEIYSGLGDDPQEFKCSEFGKSAVRAAKYLWIGLSTATGIVCCLPPATPACVVCGSAAGVAGAIGADIADEYCE
jgi:hypothetical protein